MIKKLMPSSALHVIRWHAINELLSMGVEEIDTIIALFRFVGWSVE